MSGCGCLEWSGGGGVRWGFVFNGAWWWCVCKKKIIVKKNCGQSPEINEMV